MKVSYDLYETLLPNVYLQFSQTSFDEISALWHKRNCGHKIIDFQKSSNICVSCFLRRIRLAKKKGGLIQVNVFESNFTFQANIVQSQTKRFSGALARQNSVAPARLKQRKVKQITVEEGTFMYSFTRNFFQKVKVLLRLYETLLLNVYL